MSAVSNYLRNEFVEDYLRGATTLWIGLFENNPNPSFNGSTTETTYTGYERQVITFTAYDSLTEGITNNSNIIFPPNTGATSATVAYAAVTDSKTEGNLFLFGPLAFEQTISPSNLLIIPTTELTLRVL